MLLAVQEPLSMMKIQESVRIVIHVVRNAKLLLAALNVKLTIITMSGNVIKIVQNQHMLPKFI